MKGKSILIGFALAGLLLAACGAPAQMSLPQKSADAATVVVERAVAESKAQYSVDQSVQRMVIRNATLTLVVTDTQTQLSALMRMADEFKGYVASSGTQKYDGDLRGQVVLRIPADRLDEALERAHKLAVEVREENVSGDDVTAEYVDLTSQTKNLEAAEEQLRGILAKADKTEDVLAVFEQLKNVRGQIEQAKGRMQYLSQSAAMATVTITLLPDVQAQPVQAPGWRPEGVVKTALEALIGALQGVANAVIWLAIFVLPLALVVVVPIALIVWLLRRRKGTTKTTKVVTTGS
jgi:hypothetical protein